MNTGMKQGLVTGLRQGLNPSEDKSCPEGHSDALAAFRDALAVLRSEGCTEEEIRSLLETACSDEGGAA